MIVFFSVVSFVHFFGGGFVLFALRLLLLILLTDDVFDILV